MYIEAIIQIFEALYQIDLHFMLMTDLCILWGLRRNGLTNLVYRHLNGEGHKEGITCLKLQFDKANRVGFFPLVCFDLFAIFSNTYFHYL